MTADLLNEMLERGGKFAKGILVDDQDSLMPIYHIETKAGPPVLVGCPWRNDEEKLACLSGVKRIAAEHNAVAIMSLTEVWMVKLPPVPDTPWHRRVHMQRANEIIPSQSPDRIECVFAIATDGETTVSRTWQIVRDKPGGSAIALVEEKTPDGGSYHGRLIDGLIDGILPSQKKGDET